LQSTTPANSASGNSSLLEHLCRTHVSELTSYWQTKRDAFAKAWEKLRETETRPDPLALVLPELPESYEATFSRCIDA
jgi:hypothetical protein